VAKWQDGVKILTATSLHILERIPTYECSAATMPKQVQSVPSGQSHHKQGKCQRNLKT